jgi:hypothetical protein
MESTEIYMWYNDWCMNSCGNQTECECLNNDAYDLCPIYDTDGTDGLTETEFEAMKAAVEAGTVPWPEEETPEPMPEPTEFE